MVTAPAPRPRPALALALAPLLLTACGGAFGTVIASATDGDTTTGGSAGETTAVDTETTGDTPLPPAVIPDGCNPIAYEADCLLPYPSDVFLVADDALPGGRRVALTPAATPRTLSDQPYDPLQSHPADGFSHHMPILALFPEGVDTQPLNFHLAGGDATLLAQSPTLLIEAETGHLVPHWVELDAMADDLARQALILRPFEPLRDDTRYIVAFHGLRTPLGDRIAPPLGFAHLLRGDVAGHPVLEPLAARYEDEVFSVLDELGLDRAHLTLAWDFTTATEERNTRDLLAVRDQVIAAFADAGPDIDIADVISDPSDEIALRVEGSFKVPLFLEADAPMARLHRGPDGHVAANGDHWVDFTLQVPRSVFPDGPGFTPARVIQYGHGFFGEREEINWSAMRPFSDERGFIMVATEWVGMALQDQAFVVGAMSDAPSDVFLFTDRLHQAFANQLALTYALKTTLVKELATYSYGEPLYDPDQVYWYGISQGSIFGATFLALSPLIERGVLSVGGAPYSLMMTRSGSFADLFALVKLTIGDDPLTIQKFVALSQHTWDRVDPLTYARHLLLDRYPQSPERRVLFHYGLHDHSVHNLASHLLLRAAGIPLLDPPVEQVYGLSTVPGPVDGSAAVALDIKVADPPGIYPEIPPKPAESPNAHEAPRRNPKLKDQIDAFLRPGGAIQNFCDGPCDPE